VQASVALAAVLLVVGAVIFAVDVHAQNQQITAQLVSVASTADDVTDPPPGMVLALRDKAGNVSVGAHPSMTTHMLGGPLDSPMSASEISITAPWWQTTATAASSRSSTSSPMKPAGAACWYH
jgi:hypothetical protein